MQSDDGTDLLLRTEEGWWCRRTADAASANLNVEEPAWLRPAAAEDIFDEVGTKASACGQQPPLTTAAAAMSGIFMSLHLLLGSYVRCQADTAVAAAAAAAAAEPLLPCAGMSECRQDAE